MISRRDPPSRTGEQFMLWLEQLREGDPRFAAAAVLYPWYACEWQAAVYLLTGSDRIWESIGADIMRNRSIAPAIDALERIDGSRTQHEQLMLRWATHFWDDSRRPTARTPYAFDSFHFHRWITALHLRQQLTPALAVTAPRR